LQNLAFQSGGTQGGGIVGGSFKYLEAPLKIGMFPMTWQGEEVGWWLASPELPYEALAGKAGGTGEY